MPFVRRWSVLLACLFFVAGANQLSAAEPSVASALQPFVESGSLAGAVTVVANKDKVLSLETVGFMDVGAKQAMKPDSLFWIASMSKPITGTAVMLLVDEGKLKLDDPIEKYLPEFKELQVAVANGAELKKPSRLVTVRDVMSHTSGMPFKSAKEQPTLDGLPLKDAVLSYAATPLTHEPGTKYQYSNAGINTGARIIEVISGMSYEDFMDQRLFKPLGMKDTTFWPNEEQVSRLAKPYKPSADKTKLEETTISQLTYPLSKRDNRYPMPAGGLFSTGADVATFCRMLLNGGELNGKRYLSQEALKTMTSKQTGDMVKDGYGIGWSTNGMTFGHGGALATNMTIDPQRGLITVFLVQHAGFPGDGGKSHGAFVNAANSVFGK
ncbi:MAG: serine hydrolase domain-containing protein [Planctomycetaceae bacterium]